MTPLQRTELEIALEIKRVCDENDIEYFLDGGSLLGAIRHKGFIPWDDDMDIGMKRSEYQRFLSIAQEKLDPIYILQTWDSDQGYPFSFAKVRKKDTAFVEATSYRCDHHSGVFVDIFPYDVYPDNEDDRKKQGAKLMKYSYILMMKKKMTPWKRDKGMRKLMVYAKYSMYKVMGLFVSDSKCKQIIQDELVRYNDAEGRQVFCGVPISKYGSWVLPSRNIEKLTEAEFEGHMFKVPVSYDENLTICYGDYKTLPPEDQRVTHQPLKISL